MFFNSPLEGIKVFIVSMEGENYELCCVMMKIRTKPTVQKAPEAEGRKTSLTHCSTPNPLSLLGRLVHNIAEKYDCKIK